MAILKCPLKGIFYINSQDLCFLERKCFQKGLFSIQLEWEEWEVLSLKIFFYEFAENITTLKVCQFGMSGLFQCRQYDYTGTRKRYHKNAVKFFAGPHTCHVFLSSDQVKQTLQVDRTIFFTAYSLKNILNVNKPLSPISISTCSTIN